MVALMNPADDPRGTLTPGAASATEDIAALKAQIQEMQMQIDILKESINVIKKDPGVDELLQIVRTAQKSTPDAGILSFKRSGAA
jgi:hypothetical protein